MYLNTTFRIQIIWKCWGENKTKINRELFSNRKSWFKIWRCDFFRRIWCEYNLKTSKFTNSWKFLETFCARSHYEHLDERPFFSSRTSKTPFLARLVKGKKYILQSHKGKGTILNITLRNCKTNYFRTNMDNQRSNGFSTLIMASYHLYGSLWGPITTLVRFFEKKEEGRTANLQLLPFAFIKL